MAKKKKINCKDGLDYNEELKARKTRWLLEDGDKELIELVRALYDKWYKKPTQGFLQWLYVTDYKILSSALKRMDDWTTLLI